MTLAIRAMSMLRDVGAASTTGSATRTVERVCDGMMNGRLNRS